MLAACAAENAPEFEVPEASDAAKIVVFGGSTAPGSTRADEFQEPTQLGVCKADHIKILTFKGTTTSGNSIAAGDLKILGIPEEDTKLINQLSYRDRWTTHSMTLSLRGSLDNWFVFPSIAYNTNDKNNFTLNLVTNSTKYNDLKLSIPSSVNSNSVISQIQTPELYFGRLTPYGDNFKSKKAHESEEMVYKYSYKGVTLTEDVNVQLEGRLYRIVSQLNVKISNVYPAVEKLEMYLSNVPTEIGLYAQHRTAVDQTGVDEGYWYPVVAAKGDAQHKSETGDGILVCSVSDFKDGEAVLSTFLLPSDLGRTVKVKAYIKNEGDVEGGKIIERCRLLRASKDYNLDEETSKVYYSSTELPIYKAASSEFMSYSNVRVNVTGNFSDIFSEESESNVVIEICPNYDGYHEINI